MALTCGKLATGIVQDCNPPVPGVEGRVILINRADIDFATSVSDNETNTITELILKSGTKGYEASLNENANSINVTLNAGTYFNSWTHGVTLRVFDNKTGTKKFITGLQYSSVVAIVENKSKSADGDTVYEVFGFNSGLSLNEAVRDSTDGDMRGGWVLTLSSKEPNTEAFVPYTLLYTGGLAATQTAIEAIINPLP